MRTHDEHIRRLLEETPAIDVHSHQGTHGMWQARSLWDILGYHWLATDLRCAGCPPDVFTDRALEPRERVRRAAPYSLLARNTVNHWCFMRIARDLYGFQDDYLDAGNWDWLWDAAQERVGDASWEEHVLDRAGVELVSSNYVSERLPGRYFGYESAEYMFCVGAGREVQACLTALGGKVGSAADLAAATRDRVTALVQERAIRALHVWAPTTWTYIPTDEKRADGLIHRSLASAHLEPEELDELASFSADCTAQAAGEHNLVVQLFFGSVTLEDGGPYVAMYRPEWLRALVPFFSRHRNTRFDLFMATRPASHEAAVLSRNYPNLWVSGAWWQGFTPSTLSVFFRDRLEMLPMNKWNAFYSDAYCVEWIYGKVCLSRNRLAHALVDLMEEGLITRDTVPEIAHHVLRDNARRMYLGEAG